MEKLTLVREEQPTNERRLKVVRGDAGNVMEVRECSSKKASSSMLVVSGGEPAGGGQREHGERGALIKGPTADAGERGGESALGSVR